MATTSASLLHLPSPSFFPLLSSKTSHSLPSPLSQQNPYSHSLYHCTFPSVSSRQTPPHRLMTMYGKWVFNSLTVRSESKPSINREPMLLPYNVLITVSTKDPSLDIHKERKYLMLAVRELVSGDQCEGRFVFGRDSKKPKESGNVDRFTRDGMNPKSWLQSLMVRAGHSPPKYKAKHLKTNEFTVRVEFKGMQFVGKPKKNMQLAERDAAVEALAWLTHTSYDSRDEDDMSRPDVADNMLILLGKCRRSKRQSG